MTNIVVFESNFAGSESNLLYQIDNNNSSLVDDAPALKAFLEDAIENGQIVGIAGPVYCNSPIDITVDGKLVKIVNVGNGTLIGGKGLNEPLLKIANSSSSGDTPPRSVDIQIKGMRSDLRFSPAGSLNSVNHYYFSGFRRTIMRDCSLFSGQFYQTAGGDAGIFTTSNRVIISGCIFQGMVDLGVYASGNSAGDKDNNNLLLLGNSYINCANAWSAKRNYQNIRSVGEHFEGCFNGAGCYRAGGIDEGLLSGSKVTVIGPTFKNMVNRCIDPRSSSNWHVTGMVVTGTFGTDKDDVAIENAAIIVVAGTTNSKFDFVADVVSGDPSHSAVRIQTENGNISTGNMVQGSVKGVYRGLIEASPCDGNSIDLFLNTDVAVAGTPSGASSRYSYTQNGERISMTGNRQYWDSVASPVSDGSDWTGDDAWLGGWKFYRADASGSLNEKFRVGGCSTGPTAGSFEFSVQFPGGGRPLRVTDAFVTTSVPLRYQGASQLWNIFNSTKNDGDWNDENAWIGGHKYLTADTSGTPGEVVRAGVRATGASGTSFGWGIQIGGEIKLFVRPNRFDLSLSSIGDYANDSAAATAGIPVGGVYRTGSALKIRTA